MLRITTGIAKNKRLKTPTFEGFRSVQEIAKMAMFAIIGEDIKDSVCLDLFAGSGNLGIEALSRGAAWCDFVENNRESAECIRENLNNCGLEATAILFERDVVKYVEKANKLYDFIFLDPFYENISHIHLMKNIKSILKKTGIIAFYHGENLKIEDIIKETNLEIITERKFGQCLLTLLK